MKYGALVLLRGKVKQIWKSYHVKSGTILKRPYPFLQDWPDKENYVAEKKRKIETKVLTTDHWTDAKKINTMELQSSNRKRKRPCAADFFDDKPAQVKPEKK